jgi:hypothetical protein
MIYLRAGLFAEGPTDYQFLQGLIDQLIDEISADLLAGGFEAASTLGIDAPRSMRTRSREDRIAAAIDANWNECTLFVVHGDGAGDPEGARRTQLEPGLARARAVHSDLAAATCVPVRETEAWMLADAGAFARLFETDRVPTLPHDPESERDPKKILHEVLRGMGARVERDVAKYYAELGKEIRAVELRKLSAFRRFEEDLRDAIEVVAGLRSSP